MKKIKQVVAIVMCVLLVGMYVASFVAAIFAKPQAHGLFMASVGMTIMIAVRCTHIISTKTNCL